jgi:hypothetical protein
VHATASALYKAETYQLLPSSSIEEWPHLAAALRSRRWLHFAAADELAAGQGAHIALTVAARCLALRMH